MDVFRLISEKFWIAGIWLPPNNTWADVAPDSHPDIRHADWTHLIIYPLPMALTMFIIRRCLEKYCFTPFGIYLGIKHRPARKATPQPVLERAHSRSRYVNSETVRGLSKQLDWSEAKVERWFRIRRMESRTPTLAKFAQSCWSCAYYTSAFIYGWFVLWDKEWLWDIQKCWSNYPHQSVDVWWYYMISLSFYWSLCFTQFLDVKRSDFWQMFVHHTATIMLMSFSWVCNMTRMGSLVILLHDFADVLLDGAKMAKYAGYQKLTNAMFAVLLPSWLATRMGLFPLWIMKNTLFDAGNVVPMFPAYYIFNSLLLILLGLHVFWTILLLKILKNTLATGNIEKDIRSSSEEEGSD